MRWPALFVLETINIDGLVKSKIGVAKKRVQDQGECTGAFGDNPEELGVRIVSRNDEG